jgi:hypothetical protein
MVIGFQGKPTPEGFLWPVEGFQAPEGYVWVEVRENEKGDLIPTCSDRVRQIPGGEKKLCRSPRQNMLELSGAMIFDLPHGKVWYSLEELNAPDYRDTSGLKLEFTYLKGDRVLEVKGLGDAPLANHLARAGLKKGMIFTELDGISAAKMDLWDVHRRIAGFYGDTVQFKWKSRAGYQVEPFRVIERALTPKKP